MKERVLLSGLFPRVRNKPMSDQLQVLLKEFEQNAALTGILERRRRLEERRQFELQGSDGIDALNRNLAPPFRVGLAGAATSSAVAETMRRSRVAALVEAAEARKRAAHALAAQSGAATGGNNQPGEQPISDELTLSATAVQGVRAVGASAKAKAKARSRSRAPSRSRLRSEDA